jgi:thiol-disulfide isomerase/thioredoxin
LAAAQEEAQKEHKMVLAEVTAKWCGPCQDMEKHTWPNGIIQQWIKQNAIAVQVDDDADRATADALNVHKMPTIVIFGSNNPTREITRHQGHQGANELFSWLCQVQTQENLQDAMDAQMQFFRENPAVLNAVLAGLALIVGLFSFFLFGRPLGRKMKQTRQDNLESSWVQAPTKRSSENRLIAGKWSGTYKRSNSDLSESDSSFAATLSGDDLFAGHIIDSYGEASITGAMDYPRLRFKKTYAKPIVGMQAASIFAVFYYEGRFNGADEITGTWYVAPGNKGTLRGSWQMKRSQASGLDES